MKRYKIFLVGLLSILVLGITHNKVHAAKQQTMDFEIQSIRSVSQVDRSKRYFDLLLKPGEKQTISMQIRNFSKKKITVHTSLQNAFTMTGGNINFSPYITGGLKGTDDNVGIVKDQAQALTKIGHVNKDGQVVKLNPNETKTITATIKMPEQKVRGMIYGSWHFVEYVDKKNSSGTNISGNYAYNMAINLHGQPYKVYPELKYSKTAPILKNGHPAMGIELINNQGMIINKASINAVIYKKGVFSSKRIYETTNQQVAPNTKLTIPVSWGYDTMKPGKYTIDVSVKGQNLWNKLPMTWRFKKGFTVTSDNVDQINKNALKKPVNKWVYVATASGILMIMSAVYLYRLLRFS